MMLYASLAFITKRVVGDKKKKLANLFIAETYKIASCGFYYIHSGTGTGTAVLRPPGTGTAGSEGWRFPNQPSVNTCYTHDH